VFVGKENILANHPLNLSFFMGKKSNRIQYSLWFFLLFLFSCGTNKDWSRAKERELGTRMEESAAFNNNFTGFALFDPESQTFLFEHQSDKYFTPASNTKIFTFFTALEVLGDALPVVHYAIQGDSLIFWGAGNPMMLHPGFDQEDPLLSFLRTHQDKRLFFADSNFKDDAFGPGWSWADYIYSYQPERSSLPLYGNVVRFEKTASQGRIRTHPAYFEGFLLPSLDMNAPALTRSRFSNEFSYRPDAWKGKSLNREIPFVYDGSTAVALLMDTLRLSVEYWEGDLPVEAMQTLEMATPDTLYRRLMQDSDNFIAEQLLLMSADKLSGELTAETAIAYAIDSLLPDAPDPLYWYDGSGLTRYNMFTPRTVVHVLHQLYQRQPMEKLMAIFPNGGVSGTISNLYAGENGEPFVFAKTGTLRNKHCLSGYLKTDKGKMLIFSFMHNNFPGSSNPVKADMDRVLRWIKTNY
jgi:D-alanyl-D-alanine carboxypeptidase/D-alanyl-D-alanine-endopeptidase (penicillin-binding protein 4)